MNEIEIHKIGVEKIPDLQKLGRQTFFETYEAGNTEENMRQYLEEEFSIEKLTAQLLDHDSSFYFALHQGIPVGYLKLNHGIAQTELKGSNSLEVERIYVLAAFQGNKIGQSLFEKALSIATERKVNAIWLGVWEENPKALKFYQKNGFVEFDRHIFKLGEDLQTDIMMKRMLD